MKRPILPIVLIILGVLFLGHSVGFYPIALLRHLLDRWWPAILIVVGILMLARR